MAKDFEVVVPDIGGAEGVDVIEVMVNVGEKIEIDTPLITLESDKASMEIPSTVSGQVTELAVKVGDKVSEGTLILKVKASQPVDNVSASPAEKIIPSVDEATKVEKQAMKEERVQSSIETVLVPDIGESSDIDVIEVFVSAGDEIAIDSPLITLESDKATMEIPSTSSGIIKEVLIKVGDKASMGTPLITLETVQTETKSSKAASNDVTESVKPTSPQEKPNQKKQVPIKAVAADSPPNNADVYAGPAVRRMARELGVDLSQVSGTGRKGRISKEDVTAYIKKRLSEPAGSSIEGLAFKAPAVDFSKFGEISTKPLNKIKRLTGENVHRSWVTIPHVTQFDEADITALEAFRKSQKAQAEKEGYKLTPLAFIAKAVVKALQKFPQFNSSLDESGENLILKQYYHVGIAVDTPNGLVVPVISDCDKMGVAEIAIKMAELSQKARKKALMPQDMSGGCFTISSLGGIGGTAFTPIVNGPEVAILGVSRSKMQPVYMDGEFVPRLMLPLSLSYDHRVIDGAEAARFSSFLCQSLSDIRTLLL